MSIKQQLIFWIICGLPIVLTGQHYSMNGPAIAGISSDLDGPKGIDDRSSHVSLTTYGISRRSITAEKGNNNSRTMSRTVGDKRPGFKTRSSKTGLANCDHQAQIEEVTPVTCDGLADGTVTVMGINGMTPYLYFLDDATASQDTGFFTGLSAGTHIVVVADQSGCRDTAEFEVPAPLPLLATVQQEKAVSCPDGEDGILRAAVSGGLGPYRYEWVGLNRPDTSTIGGLEPGTYQLLVTDQNGCTATTDFILGNPQGMQIDLTPLATSCSDTQDGSVLTNVTGGTPDYTFLWDNGATVMEPDDFAPGEQCLTVTDGRGCQETVCITIAAPEPLTLDSVAVTPADCFGTNTGSATVFVSGGTGDYTYLWNDNLQQISAQALRLPAGSYTVDISDENNCSTLEQVEVSEPGPLVAMPAPEDATCFGGADGIASVLLSGGNAPFTYQWSTGGTALEETGLTSGTYEVSITDAKGCEAATEVFIDQPATPVRVQAVQTYQGCPGAAANEVEAMASGGTGSGYVFQWNDPAQQTGPTASALDSSVYVVTAMDSDGCAGTDTIDLMDLPAINIGIIANAPSCSNTQDGRMGVNRVEGGSGGDDPSNFSFVWSTGATGLTISNLAGDTEYSVTATDNRGCVGVQSRFLPQPDTIGFTFELTDVSCHRGSDGSATITNISGPNSNFTINWSAGTGSQTGPLADGLGAGTYRVTVTDGRNCSNSGSIVIREPEPIELAFETDDVDCFGGNEGTISVMVTGGRAGYQYQWSNNLPAEPQVRNLPAGTYQLTVTDANNCTIVERVTIEQPPTVAVNLNIKDVTCFGSRDGRIEITPLGGTPPYQYSLNNIDYNGIATRIGLPAGDQVVYVRDAEGCLYAEPVQVGTPPEFLIDLGPDLTIRLGDTISLSAELIDPAGGIADLFWSAPYAGTISCEQCDRPMVYPQNSIIYKATAIDSNGCEAEDQIRITVEKPRSVLVPTGFSPNGDSVNDRLIVHGLEGTTIKVFRIFDRWGELLYEQFNFPVNDPVEGWDGTFRGQPLNSGVYIWYLEAIYPFDQTEESFKGQTTLIR